LKVVTAKDFAKAFDVSESDIVDKCGQLIDSYDFSYNYIDGEQRDQLIIKILERIKEDNQVIGEPKRKDVWQNGWQENLNEFIDSGYDLKALVPKYIRSNQPIRFMQKYILPHAPEFELHFFDVYRQWLLKTYFNDVDNCYEFGCGTGFNLVALAKLFPKMKLYGLDFVKSSYDLVNDIAKAYSFNLKGYLFNMIEPDEHLRIKSDSGVFTIGSIEQLRGKFHDFIEYLIHNRPNVVVFTEPVVELYDIEKLEDYLAYRFQEKRGYTRDLLPYLQKLEGQNRIKIEKIRRLYFGSLFMEGYNLIAWRPV
jgi:SAM-dependent methyltransferase